MDEKRAERLYGRALDILERRANGHALPIVWKLAIRRYPPAVNLLTDFLCDDRAVKLLRPLARRGDATSGYNLAITLRNGGDMWGYRTTLALAARHDEGCAHELRRFKVRFPYGAMRRWRRLEPSWLR